MRDAGLVEERDTEQLYSLGLQKFLADRYVTGTCPKCGYEVRRTAAARREVMHFHP